MDTAAYWRRCSTCKRPIAYLAQYWVCSVSTCNRKRSGMVFCSHTCWDAHVPVMNHREAWCSEKQAPAKSERAEASAVPSRDQKPKAAASLQADSSPLGRGSSEKEILIVASKLKAFIREQSGMNTSAGVLEVLSDKVRQMSDAAIKSAEEAGRQTVMDRDVAALSPGGKTAADSRGQIIRRRPQGD